MIIVARNEKRLSEASSVLREAAAEGIDVIAWVVDLADWNAVQKNLIDKIAALPENVRIVHLVNSAGVFVPKPFVELTPEDYDVS